MASKKQGLSSIGRKAIMALTGFFLMFFLLQHLSINMISIVDGDLFNEVSHFMGTNPLVQFVLQPVLIFSVIFHFAWGMYLEYQNNQAREVKYAMYKGSANASWMSRNMIVSGLAVLAFLALHFYDFWIPEINVKYVQGDMSGMLPGADEFRYYEELVHKFAGQPIRVALYVISFVMLSLHLLHGFQSAFQSVGYNSTKYTPLIKKLGNIFAIAVPAGFVLVALVHFFNH
ncbi:MAG: succinate dehydrogenase cytochrome b subunit [Bacteroidetes bacterium]|jgi:succinate dehydrogenase / fumarate reductase cytochrome b subunit|nr:succinate dehydrogenase cytochrome b subunit [Bacteroidota bacterium]